MMCEVRNKNRFLLASLATVLAMAGCAYHNPAASTGTSVDLSVPSQVTLGALPGSGAQANIAALTARVQNANGAALGNVLVTFTTTRGSITPASVTTGSDGSASATLVASDTANVTAAVGTLAAHTLVATQTPTTPSNPTPTPTPAPPPTPTPTLPAVFLNVSSSGTTGVPLTFGISTSAIGVKWTWDFGDGATIFSTAFTMTHTYATRGTWTATVSSPVTSTGSATIVVTDPPVQAPTPAGPTLAAALTCTPGIHATPTTSCNLTMTYGGTALPGANVTAVTWDWSDGTTANNSSTAPVNFHQYQFAGTYTVFATVTANTTDGVRTTTTSKSVVVP